MKQSHGSTRPVASIIPIALIVASLSLLNFALKALPVGTAYGIWTGIGTVGTALVGIFVYDEPATAPRLMCIALIVAGIVGLRIVSQS